MQKLQNKFMGVLWYLCNNGKVVKLCPHILHISQYPTPTNGFTAHVTIYCAMLGIHLFDGLSSYM
jgi:hypothetical protein